MMLFQMVCCMCARVVCSRHKELTVRKAQTHTKAETRKLRKHTNHKKETIGWDFGTKNGSMVANKDEGPPLPGLRVAMSGVVVYIVYLGSIVLCRKSFFFVSRNVAATHSD